MILYKLILILLVIILAEATARTVRSGRLFKQFQRSDMARSRHKSLGRTLLIITIVTVIAIEIGVIVTGREWDFLTGVHFIFALPFGISVPLLVTALNGEKFAHHGKVVYFVLLPAFAGAVLTGIPLILRF